VLALKQPGIIVTIVADSSYVIGVLSQYWKAAKNKDLITEIKSLMEQHGVTLGMAGVSRLSSTSKALRRTSLAADPIGLRLEFSMDMWHTVAASPLMKGGFDDGL